ncbi:MAG: hypothetical protein LUE24_11990 [Lachnospiraceae bacterium]|nr:hypothetical protein [Lachnospiraceae bacterium]
MDKYEYRLKAEQIEKLAKKKDYKTAAKIADSIDWRRVRNPNMLYVVAEVYEAEERYEDCMEILNIAYDRAPVGRMLLYKMTEVATRMHQFQEAIALYREFVKVAPHDQSRYILKYQIYRERGSAVTDQIRILKDYKTCEYQERWAYELASLYAEAGMEEDCVRECDELILWFSEGEYVRKAMELKQRYQPLTAAQQEKYDNPGRVVISSDDFEDTEVAVEAGKFSTMDLQAELAANLDELLQSQATIDIPDLSVEEPVPEPEPAPVPQAEEQEADEEEKEIGIELVELSLDGLEEDVSEESVSETFVQESDSAQSESGEPESAGVEPAASVSREVEEALEPESEPEEDMPPEFELLCDLEELQEATVAVPVMPEPEMKESVFGLSNIVDKPEQQGKSESEESEPDELKPVEELSLEDFHLEELGLKELEMPESAEPEPVESEIPKPESVEQEAAEPELAEPEASEPELVGSEPVEPETLEPVELKSSEPELTEEDISEIRAEETPEQKPQTGPLSIPDVLAEWEDQKAKTEAILEAGAENAQVRKERVKQETAELMKIISGTTAEIPEDVRQILNEIEQEQQETAATAVTEDDLPQDVDAEEEEAGGGELLEDLGSSVTEEKKGTVSSETASLNTIQELERSLAAQTAEKAVKAGHLTREQARLFTYFTSVSGMSKQLSGLLKGAVDENKSSSSSGNLVITGPRGNGKTTLAIDVVKALQKEKRIEGRKLAKVSGKKLNSKDVYEVFSKLKGGALIIEGAGGLADETLVGLSLVMEGDTGGLLVILEDSAEEVERIFLRNKNFASKFDYTVDIPIFSNDELVNFGKAYALEAGYAFDEFGVLALYDRIGSRQTLEHNVTVAEVKDIIDAAVEHAEKSTIGHMIARITGKNTDEDGNFLLKEEDF